MIDEITRILKNRMSDYAIFDYDKESDTIIITMSDRVVDLICECVSVDLSVAGYRKADKMQVPKAKKRMFCKQYEKVLGIEKKNIIKGFAEKLKEKFNGYDATSYNGYEEGFHNLQEEIDELLKEYE